MNSGHTSARAPLPWVTITMHIVLILLYCALLGVWATEAEHNLVVPLGLKTNELSVSIVIVSQAIVVVSFMSTSLLQALTGCCGPPPLSSTLRH